MNQSSQHHILMLSLLCFIPDNILYGSNRTRTVSGRTIRSQRKTAGRARIRPIGVLLTRSVDRRRNRSRRRLQIGRSIAAIARRRLGGRDSSPSPIADGVPFTTRCAPGRHRIARIVSRQSVVDTKGGVGCRRVVGDRLPIRRLRLLRAIR